LGNPMIRGILQQNRKHSSAQGIPEPFDHSVYLGQTRGARAQRRSRTGDLRASVGSTGATCFGVVGPLHRSTRTSWKWPRSSPCSGLPARTALSRDLEPECLSGRIVARLSGSHRVAKIESRPGPWPPVRPPGCTPSLVHASIACSNRDGARRSFGRNGRAWNGDRLILTRVDDRRERRVPLGPYAQCLRSGGSTPGHVCPHALGASDPGSVRIRTGIHLVD
jgi:hypothetical protein